MFRFEFHRIENSTASSTRNGISLSDLYLQFGSRNTDFIGRKIEVQNFVRKYSFFLGFFNCSFAKLRRTAKRPTVLSSWLPMLTIPITLSKIYFLTNFRIFYQVFLKKIGKIQHFQILMPMDWKLNYEFNEV